jgi:CRISPR-associated protein Csd1
MMYFVVESQLKDASFSNGACAQASSIDDQRFFAAKIPQSAGDAYVTVHTFQINDTLYCKAFNGRTVAIVHLLEPKPRGWVRPPSIQRLLVKTTALQEKFDNIPPQLAGEVTRSVLTGLPYPRTLLLAAITRLRAGDDASSGWHAAVIKACINRALRFRLPTTGDAERDTELDKRRQKEGLPVALERDKKDTAYQLGRLFAVLESAQYAALGRVNAPIGDRYYASASATPARVFGPLLRGLKHHVSDAKKRGRGGWIEPKVGEIMLMLPPDLPKTLRLEDQGRFAVGYYHERATRPPKDDSETEGEDNGE